MKEFRTRNDFFYFQIATRYYLNYTKSLKELTNKNNLKDLPDVETLSKEIADENLSLEELLKKIDDFGFRDFTLNFFQLRTFGTMSTVCSALCLEALINDYCVLKKSANFLNKYVDKLDPVSKWKIFPELFCGKSLSSDGKAFELLSELYSFRNSLVHPKSKNIKNTTNQKRDNDLLREEFISQIKKFNHSFPTIREATLELNKIDPSFSYLKEYKWLWNEEEVQDLALSSFENFFKSLTNEDFTKFKK